MARPRGIMAAAFIAVFWPSAVPSPVQAQTARLVSASAVERHASHLTRGRVSGSRERRSRRAAAGRDGIDARRHDGDDRCRRSRPLHARCVAVRGVRPACAHERVCGVAATVRPRGCVAGGLSFAVAPPRWHPSATSGAGPVEARPIVAAGFGLPAGPQPDSADRRATAT